MSDQHIAKDVQRRIRRRTAAFLRNQAMHLSSIYFAKVAFSGMLAALKYYQFSRLFKTPAIVHAVPSEKVFKTILQHRKLLRSSDRPETDNPLMSFVDRLAGLTDGIWFCSGFAYNVNPKDFPYGVILSVNEIDSHFDVFKLEINHFFYREIVRYWYEEEREVFTALCRDLRMKDQLETFIATDKTEPIKKGYRAGILFPWANADCFEEGYRLTKHKDALQRRLDRCKRELEVKSMKQGYVRNEFLKADNWTKPEIIAHRTVELNSQHLIGFFIADAFATSHKSIKRAISKFLSKSQKVNKERLVVFDGKQKMLIDDWLSRL